MTPDDPNWPGRELWSGPSATSAFMWLDVVIGVAVGFMLGVVLVLLGFMVAR
jgi:hypothetical protein